MKQFGILLAVSSLPTPYGIGDLGKAAYTWVDILHANGIDIWQILPLNPLGYGNSPYQPYSSFAGDSIYLSLELLYEDGLLSELPTAFSGKKKNIDYPAVRTWKNGWLRKAYENFVPDEAYHIFAQQDWVKEYAIFCAFKLENAGKCWVDWKPQYRDWAKSKVLDLQPFSQEIAYQIFLQYLFVKQWEQLHTYAKSKKIQILGDIPFYVGLDSVDVWAHQENFLLHEDGHPQFIAGVPPDYFSETGQRWGNPIYNWEKLQKDEFNFWVKRVGYNQKLFDIIRIDHFRAFDTYWKIPATCPTAVEGEWIEAPGYAVLDALYAQIPDLHLVAEDLGDLRPEVLVLKDHYHLKGMSVLEFTLDFSGKYVRYTGTEDSNVILYTGTHDNATLAEWYFSLSQVQKRKLKKWLKTQGFYNGSVVKRLNEYALSRHADWIIIPASDIMECTSTARMNTPGTVGSPNWEWQMQNFDSIEKMLPKYQMLIERK